MEKKPITSSLFKFVTLRSPQLADERKKELLFVSYPEEKETESLAHRSVSGLSLVQEKERAEALANAYTIENFQAIENRQQLRKNYGKLYDFSSWLMRNKNYFTAKSIAENLDVILYNGNSSPEEILTIENALLLKEEDEVLLWNNLFYQTIHKVSTPVREGLIQMLIANHFLKGYNEFVEGYAQSNIIDGTTVRETEFLVNESTEITIEFTEEQKKEFVLRANASVIIPKEVLFAPKSEIDLTSKNGLTSIQSDFLDKTVLVEQAKSRLKVYNTALLEVQRAEIVYNKEEQKKYQDAVAAYEQKIAEVNNQPIIDTIIDPVTNEESVVKIIRDVSNISIDYIKSEEIIRLADGVTPTVFQSKILEQLSSVTQDLINSLEFLIYDTFAEVKTALQAKIKREKEIILTNTPQVTTNINIGGETVTQNVSNRELKMSYIGYVDSGVNDLLSSIKLSFFLNNTSNVTVLDAQYAITNSDTGDIVYDGRSFKNLSSTTSTKLDVELFSEKIGLRAATYKMYGELALSDGRIIVFENDRHITITRDENGYLTSKGIEGQFSFKGDSDVSNPDSGNPSNETIYGVTQLGIADFRRVEQEVCCYVPGEVSHIENVMAREYKERTTRNLTSSESITEESYEREAEVLTDTTSTERNELQSEASSIVNKDNATNFGANASVTGDIFGGKFSAGTSFNSSSSNSSSDSNLQAQTYAQEVTERALERVVEKVSKKRTSRILKEYEENITHGYDNRKGDEHVTGVYRWVDVIYKNKLVNYGKRLMYEFTIPEPAKYYISSYIKREKNTDKISNKLIVPKKPIHPIELKIEGVINNGLFGASILTEDNYQRIAAEYNAEVNPVPQLSLRATKGFGSNFNKGGIEVGFLTSETGEIDIPEGYEVNESYASVDYHFHKDEREYPGFSIHVGGKSFGKFFSASHPNLNSSDFDGIAFKKDDIVFTDLGGVQNKLGVAFESYDTGTIAISISAVCTRTDEYYQKWQNETFNAIMEAYYDRVQEYNDFQQSQEVAPEEKERQREFSSQLNRSIEKQELKRIAIDLITAPFKDKFTVSQSHYGADSKTVIKSEKLNNHASVVRFFEQAFDWEIMAYTFYPYFYKNQDDWDANFDFLDGNDPIFKAFLQSGMARTVVPVKQGFEYAVNWFMNTGELWGGQGMITDTEDDLYVSVAEEMLEPSGVVEGESWQTRVPTALTILQADSVVLKEGGLPCNSDCKEHSLFDSSTYKLGDGNSTSEPSPEGVDFDIVGETNDIR
ncbi:hypothetical protein ACSIGC_11205 [Tenacibaculum sp. ZS6-P6]|uniref:hypothetical protein n=1 Tax=Tenacibaculum sp. ZS6-P6 TaxID=3447503 RepID=UPI003F9D8720